jgi:hypothetical protein
MKKFVDLGTECAEYLKVAKASEGEFFVLSLLVLYASLCFLFDFSFPLLLNCRCFCISQCSHCIAES